MWTGTDRTHVELMVERQLLVCSDQRRRIEGRNLLECADVRREAGLHVELKMITKFRIGYRVNVNGEI